MTSLDLVRQRLARFARSEAHGVSPLYEHLAAHAADDPEVAGLLTAAPERFAHATLLLAAAHRLVQAEPFHELSNYYPSLGGTYGADEGTWRLFREFVLQRADRMRELIATRAPSARSRSQGCGVRGRWKGPPSQSIPGRGAICGVRSKSCGRRAKRDARKSTNTPATPHSSFAFSKVGSISSPMSRRTIWSPRRLQPALVRLFGIGRLLRS